MAVKNKYSNIQEELGWLSEKAEQIKEFVNDNPYHLVTDRSMVIKQIFNSVGDLVGEDYKLVATIETQHKSLRDSLKEYSQLIEIIDGLREKEAAKVESRGNAKISKIAGDFLKERL